MGLEPHTPWMFHRDEIDLLEEDLDAIYDTFVKTNGDPTMEEMLIQEQLDTEEASEIEWVLHGESFFSHRSTTEHAKDPHEGHSAETMHQQLMQNVERPPFYEQVYVWSQTVFAIGKELHTMHIVDEEHAFHVYLNAKLIPLKLANAITEEWNHDAISRELAMKEYRLALTYFDRVLSSLACIAEELHDHTFDPLLKKGYELEYILETYFKKMNRRSTFPPV